jgi:hypothetical protein
MALPVNTRQQSRNRTRVATSTVWAEVPPESLTAIMEGRMKGCFARSRWQASESISTWMAPGCPQTGPVRACLRPWTCCEPHMGAQGQAIGVGRVAIGRT